MFIMRKDQINTIFGKNTKIYAWEKFYFHKKMFRKSFPNFDNLIISSSDPEIMAIEFAVINRNYTFQMSMFSCREFFFYLDLIVSIVDRKNVELPWSTPNG